MAGAINALRSFRYTLLLTDCVAAAFRETLARGIGSAKAFGFGMLSVAPA